MMVHGSKLGQKKQDEEDRQIAFDTEISQDVNLEDKQFSPWIKKEISMNNDQKQQSKELSDEFLSKIKFKHKKKLPLPGLDRNNENAHLLKRLNGQQILDEDYIDIIKVNRKVIEEKSYFQKRSTAANSHHKPKYVELSLDFQLTKNIKKPSPLRSISPFSSENKKKDFVIKKNEKKRYANDLEKEFLEQADELRRNIGTARFYRTLELHLYPLNERKTQSRDTKQERLRFTSLNNRTKYSNFPKKPNKTTEMQCKGKNLQSSHQPSRREKLKLKLQQKEMKEVIFLQ